MKIDVKNLTLDQYRKMIGLKLPNDIEKAININTYYRLIKGRNKRSSQEKSIEKLRKLFKVDRKTFDLLLSNQLSNKLNNK